MRALDFISKHGKAARACAAALTCALAAGAAALAGSVEVARVAGPEPVEEVPQEVGAQEEKTPRELADEQLPEEARDARGSYGDLERQIVATLSGSVWTAGAPGTALSFDGATFTEACGQEASCTAYAIVAASAPEASRDGATERTVQHFTLRTPSGTYMAALTSEAYADGSASVTTLESGAFSLSRAWTAAARAASVVVEGPEEGWFAQNGTTPQALTDAFDSFAGTSWPTVSSARWDGTVSYDYARGAAVLPFRLDDAGGTRVRAVLDLGAGTFSVEEA